MFEQLCIFWQCKMNSFCLERSFTGFRAGWDRMELKPLYHRVNEVESKVIFYSPSGCLASYPVCCAADKRCCQVWKFIYASRFHFNDFLPLFTILASDDCWVSTWEKSKSELRVIEQLSLKIVPYLLFGLRCEHLYEV